MPPENKDFTNYSTQHPFADGNGRTARALATLILYIRGFDIKRFFALDDYYDMIEKHTTKP